MTRHQAACPITKGQPVCRTQAHNRSAPTPTGAVGDYVTLEAHSVPQRALQQLAVHAAGLAVDCGAWQGATMGEGLLSNAGCTVRWVAGQPLHTRLTQLHYCMRHPGSISPHSRGSAHPCCSCT